MLLILLCFPSFYISSFHLNNIWFSRFSYSFICLSRFEWMHTLSTHMQTFWFQAIYIIPIFNFMLFFLCFLASSWLLINHVPLKDLMKGLCKLEYITGFNIRHSWPHIECLVVNTMINFLKKKLAKQCLILLFPDIMLAYGGCQLNLCTLCAHIECSHASTLVSMSKFSKQ